MSDGKICIIGAAGQLGIALQNRYPEATGLDIGELDITDFQAVSAHNWDGVGTILNAAAFTNVDGAETAEGRIAAWKVNASAVSNLSRICHSKSILLVHISTDYVFDGTRSPHSETEPFAPLNVYGQSKAAGDLTVSMLGKYYILRTSWVIGEGKNFVRTMLDVGKKGINPSVVSDQIGRLTFTSELVRAIDYLQVHRPAFGTYNLTNSGESVSWAEITRQIFALAGFPNTVSDVTTEQYYAGKSGIAPRPLLSTLDLTKMQSTGFVSTDWQADLKSYVSKEMS